MFSLNSTSTYKFITYSNSQDYKKHEQRVLSRDNNMTTGRPDLAFNISNGYLTFNVKLFTLTEAFLRIYDYKYLNELKIVYS